MNAYSALGYCKLYSGLIDGVIPLVEQAIRLSPRDPEIGNCYFRIGIDRLSTLWRLILGAAEAGTWKRNNSAKA